MMLAVGITSVSRKEQKGKNYQEAGGNQTTTEIRNSACY